MVMGITNCEEAPNSAICLLLCVGDCVESPSGQNIKVFGASGIIQVVWRQFNFTTTGKTRLPVRLDSDSIVCRRFYKSFDYFTLSKSPNVNPKPQSLVLCKQKKAPMCTP